LDRVNTYTYTARHADDPRVVVTFTLQGDSLLVDLGAPLEQIERTLQLREGGARLQGWLKPVAVALLQRGTHPFSVADVYAGAAGGGLRVTPWVRVGGLRLAPVPFTFTRVDNPEAAQGFVRELQRRRGIAPRPGRLPGPFDYWGGWLLTTSLAAGLIMAWGMRRRQSSRS